MGYDMHWIEGMTPAEEAEYVLKRDAFEAAALERDTAYPLTENPNRAIPEDEVEAFLAEHPEFTVFDDEFGHPPGLKRVAPKVFVEAQAKVSAAYEAMQDANKSYYRLNIWGMGDMRNLMDRFGMLTWDEGDPPSWPKAEHFGINEEEEGWEELPPTHPFHVALNRRLEWNPHPEQGIGGWKFCDNSGWRVTPEEIHNSLGQLDLVAPEDKVVAFAELASSWDAGAEAKDVAEWFHHWCDWLREAEKRGGLAVY